MSNSDRLTGPDFLDSVADQSDAQGLPVNAAEFRQRATDWRADQARIEQLEADLARLERQLRSDTERAQILDKLKTHLQAADEALAWPPPPTPPTRLAAETSNARGEVVAWFPTYASGEIVRNYGDGSPVYACKTKEEAEQAKRCHLGATGPVIPLYAAPPPAAAEPKTLPVPTRVYLTDKAAVIVGDPQRGWDEEGPDAHNCDAMGCASIGPHVLAHVPFTDERAMSQPAEAQAQGGGEVVQRLRGVLEHGKMGDKCLIAPDLVTAAIAALSASQPAALRIVEPILNRATPGTREAEMAVLETDENGVPTIWCDPEIADLVRALNVGGVRTVASCSGHGERLGSIALADGRALVICSSPDEAIAVIRSHEGQQSVVAGEEIMVNAAHDVYTLPLQPSGLSSGPRFVVHVPGPEQQPAAADGVKCPWDEGSPCVDPRPAGMVYPTKPAPRASGYLDSSGVEWNAWDAGQMEAYARAAYSDGWEAGCREALAQQPAAVDEAQGEAIRARRQQIAGWLEGLGQAARSLRTIADQAGKVEGMEDMEGVRGYANSRATVAEAALAANDTLATPPAAATR